MADDEQNVEMHFDSYPPSAGEITLRTVGFGLSAMNLLLEITEIENGDAAVTVTLGGVENDDVPDFIDTVVELLGVVKDQTVQQLKVVD